MSRSVLSVSLLMSVALMLGRLSGMLREQVLGVRLGADETTDAILLMLTLPDLLVGLILSGGFGAVLVPVFRRASAETRAALFHLAAVLSACAGLVVAIALALLARPVLDLLAQSLDHRSISGFGTAFRLSLLAIPLAALIGAATAYLNAVGKFSVPAASVVVFNLILAAYFLLMQVPVGFAGFALCLILAMMVRLSVQAAMMPEALRRAPRSARFETGVLRRFGMGVLASGIVVAVPLVFRSLYSAGGDGYLAQFNFALRIFELPNAIVVAPLVAVFLPVLSDADSLGGGRFEKAQAEALEIGFAAALIAAAIGALNAEPITRLLFGYGAITEEMISDIALVLALLLSGLPFAAVFQITAAGLNARSRTGIVMRNSALALLVSIASYLLLSVAGAGPWTAVFGVVVFNLASAILNLLSLMPAGELAQMLIGFGRQVVRVTLVLTPFFLIETISGPLPLAASILLIVLEAAVLLFFSRSLLRRLQAIRIAQLG